MILTCVLCMCFVYVCFVYQRIRKDQNAARHAVASNGTKRGGGTSEMGIAATVSNLKTAAWNRWREIEWDLKGTRISCVQYKKDGFSYEPVYT